MSTITKIRIYLVAATILLSSCEKNTAPYEVHSDSKDGAMVYIAKSINGVQNLQIFPYQEARTFQFAAGLGMLGYPSLAVDITLSEDIHAFDSINVVRELNGLPPYEPFPKDAYEIDKLKLTIPAGAVSSDFVTLTYHPEAFDSETDHLLAITITDASGYAINPAAKTILLAANKLEERRAETNGWIATASTEQLSGENTGLASAVLDGDLNTIWHSRYNGGERSSYPHWLSVDMVNETYVTKIALAPRQNNPRGFTKFNLEGSTDGKTWFVLGEELAFDPAHLSYQEYPIEPQYLRNIRITMTEGLQDLTFLAEFAVFTY